MLCCAVLPNFESRNMTIDEMHHGELKTTLVSCNLEIDW
jgi:hypothetical protein